MGLGLGRHSSLVSWRYLDGCLQCEHFPHGPSVLGERLLGSFSRAKGELSASGLPPAAGGRVTATSPDKLPLSPALWVGACSLQQNPSQCVCSSSHSTMDPQGLWYIGLHCPSSHLQQVAVSSRGAAYFLNIFSPLWVMPCFHTDVLASR